MAWFLIPLVAFFVAALTLFSGFGLGTLLMPAFAVVFPIHVAVAATAVVHILNNIFKLGLVGRYADPKIVARFGIPAALASFAGALSLAAMEGIEPLHRWTLRGRVHEITVAGVVIGVVVILFAMLDLLPRFSRVAFDQRFLPLGGALSGFFGGLSGNQGALRSAFLIKSGLSKEAFIGTGVVCAIIVDVARLLVYGAAFWSAKFSAVPDGAWGIVAVSTAAAFVGSYFGAKLVKKVTLHALQLIVGAMLVIIGIALVAGVV
ncbi:MAG: TSUP family transporter [Thermoanaerobaculia bacterium]|nr:TSUP family transporter [Thermoanaerobaculia bacterium]